MGYPFRLSARGNPDRIASSSDCKLAGSRSQYPYLCFLAPPRSIFTAFGRLVARLFSGLIKRQRKEKLCAPYDSRLLGILRSLKPSKFLRRLRTRRPQSCVSDGQASINLSDAQGRRRGLEAENVAANPWRRFCRSGRGWAARVDRRRSLGHGRRYWLYPRWNPRRADRRAGRQPASQAQKPQLRRGGVGWGQLHGRLVRHRSGGPET